MSMHRVYVYEGFTERTDRTGCHLICTIDKSQLESLTYYSLFAHELFASVSAASACDISQLLNIQSAFQARLHIPRVTVTSYMLPILTTPRHPTDRATTVSANVTFARTTA